MSALNKYRYPYHPQDMSGLNKYANPYAAQEMSGLNYGCPYAAQGYYQRPPVMAPPPQYPAAPPPPPPPPPRREPGFLEGCLMAFRCCGLAGEYSDDPSGFGVF